MNRLSDKGSGKWPLLAAFLIPCGGMLILMAICGYSPFGSSRALLYSDSYHQYYPFFRNFREVLRSGGSLLYNWDIGMGVDYLGLIAYYLGSPLNLLSALVPDSFVLPFFSLLMPVRLGLAGLFFAIMLRGIYGRKDLLPAVFGSFYALCAWAMGYQWNVMWLDTFALLPLVMLGMLQLLRERRFVLYVLALAMSWGSNYYIGLFTCYFVFLVFCGYQVCRWRGLKRFFGDLFCMGVYSVLALGLTAALTLPAVASLGSTQSSVNLFPTTFRLNIAASHDLKGLLDALRQVLGNLGGGLEPSMKEGLPNLYCGVGTLLLGILYLLCRDAPLRDRICAFLLLLFLALSFIIRQLDYIWHGFHFTNMIPYRFSFLFSFVLICMAYAAWVRRRQFTRLQIAAAAVLTAGILACSPHLFEMETGRILSRTLKAPVYYLFNAGFLAAYFYILFLAAGKYRPADDSQEAASLARSRTRRRRRICRWVLCGIFLAETVCNLCNFASRFPATGISNYPLGTESTASVIRVMQEREADREFYRAETAHSQALNDAALNGYSGVSAFTSSANVRITLFMKALGYGAKNTYNRYCWEESSPVSNLFLNLKYMLDRDSNDKSSTWFREINRFGRTSLYENQAWLPLGFLAEEELASVPLLYGDDSFDVQNQLFAAAAGLGSDVWHPVPMSECEVIGSSAEVSDIRSNGFCRYENADSGANVIYSFRADREGFACVRLNLSANSDVYLSVNGRELYKDTVGLPQMLALTDVEEGDCIDIRIVCGDKKSGNMTVNLGILDNALFARGYEQLRRDVMQIDSFTDTRVVGRISCSRDGLLYTSIPQNGCWHARVDGEEAQIELVGDCMIALHLTQGEHTLVFRYENRAFLAGLIITTACLLVFLLLLIRCLLQLENGEHVQQPAAAEELAQSLQQPAPEGPESTDRETGAT